MTGSVSSRRTPHSRLLELRINAGMTPNDLAYRAGVAGKTIRMVEAGFIPSPRTQHAIAQVFGLRPLDLWPIERGRQVIR